jgi:hypothetical protein
MKAIQHLAILVKLPARQSLCNMANLRIHCPHNEGKKQVAVRTSLTSDDTGRFGTLHGDMFDPISAMAE